MKKIKNSIHIKGTITIRAYKAGTKELLSEKIYRNTIMQSSGRGKDLLIQRLIGNNTYTANINYGAIGTSATAVSANDTQLGAETARTTVALSQESGYNVATLQFFLPDSQLANGTYYEFGTFVDGTGSANSGQLFNRALFTTPYIKTSGTDTTVQLDITFT